MEIIAAIVLVCSFSLGNAQVNQLKINDVMIRKQKCITELAKCMETKPRIEAYLIKCMARR